MTKIYPTAVLLGFASTMTLQADNALTSDGRLTYYGDLRGRYELDHDSQSASGTMRDDRHRARIRARFGLNYELERNWRAGIRLRTGSHRSQQSPHLTFQTDDGDSDDLDFVLDKYFVEYGFDSCSVWAGRNSFPFWKQNELFWDDDVTPTGVAASASQDFLGGDVTVTLGGFVLPDGGWHVHQPMAAGQVKYAGEFANVKVTVAPGFFYMFGEDDASRYLLTGNGMRDYAIGSFSAQLASEVAGVPVALGVDLYKNFESYGPSDPFVTAANKDEDFGYVLSATLGRLKKQGDWLLGYYYSHIEQFAVNASYAQDDWVRWGNGPQTRSSNFEGHELRAAYAVLDDLNIVARWYIVEAVKGVEDGNRFRLDANFKF